MKRDKYQLLGRLHAEEKAALEADIAKRGVLVPVETDEDGNILDGHHRVEIADRLGKPYETIVRAFGGEEEKREHVIMLNLARRHLDPLRWGQAFRSLLEVRGVQRGKGGDRKSSATMALDSVANIIQELGVPERTAKRRLAAADKFDVLTPESQAKVESGEMALADAIREEKRAQVRANLESIENKEAKRIAGVYDVLVIDPPWPMKKIERDCAPEQPAELDYHTMTEEELAALTVPAADDCHVWLWTTHRFLPMALELLNAWELKYVCTFVWHKPGGFQPNGLPQYNCEFALYARKGTPIFLDTKDFPVCFNAPRGEHSEKPEEFYTTVRRVTAGRRLDMFSRRAIDGFDSWGREAIG